MVQRIMNVLNWVELGGETPLNFIGGKPRRIRIEVNSPDDARLTLANGDGELTFLALVRGRDTIEFEVDERDYALFADESCFVLTYDGDAVHATVPDAVSFARIIERAPVNRDMQYMMNALMQNQQRMFNAQQQHFEQRLAAATTAAAVKSAPSADAGAAARKPASRPASGDAAGNKPADGGSGGDGSQ